MIKKKWKRRKTPKKTQQNRTATTAVAKVRCKRCKSILKIQNLQANVQSKRAKDNERGATTTTLTGKVLRSLLTCAQFPLTLDTLPPPPVPPSLAAACARHSARRYQSKQSDKATNCANLHHDKQVSGKSSPPQVPLAPAPCCHIGVDNNRWRYQSERLHRDIGPPAHCPLFACLVRCCKWLFAAAALLCA